MLLANHAIAGLRSGSFRETHFQNGERPKCRVHFYGSMGNVSQTPDFVIQKRFKCLFGFAAGAGKSVFWYVVKLFVPSRELIAFVSSTIIEGIHAMQKAGLAS